MENVLEHANQKEFYSSLIKNCFPLTKERVLLALYDRVTPYRKGVVSVNTTLHLEGNVSNITMTESLFGNVVTVDFSRDNVVQNTVKGFLRKVIIGSNNIQPIAEYVAILSGFGIAEFNVNGYVDVIDDLGKVTDIIKIPNNGLSDEIIVKRSVVKSIPVYSVYPKSNPNDNVDFVVWDDVMKEYDAYIPSCSATPNINSGWGLDDLLKDIIDIPTHCSTDLEVLGLYRGLMGKKNSIKIVTESDETETTVAIFTNPDLSFERINVSITIDTVDDYKNKHVEHISTWLTTKTALVGSKRISAIFG